MNDFFYFREKRNEELYKFFLIFFEVYIRSAYIFISQKFQNIINGKFKFWLYGAL